jgi:hypothetical protein
MTDGREWIRRRYLAELESWLNPVALHYIFTRTPATDPYNNPIIDAEFEQLAQHFPQAAEGITAQECQAFIEALPERDRLRKQSQSHEAERRKAERKAGHVAATTYAKQRLQQAAAPNATPTIPGL